MIDRRRVAPYPPKRLRRRLGLALTSTTAGAAARLTPSVVAAPEICSATRNERGAVSVEEFSRG
jgi:hypothetical protein